MALDEARAKDELRNKALHSLQQLKATVATLASIPKLRYLKEQAGNLLDSAMDAIAVTTRPAPTVIQSPGSTATVTHTGGAAQTQRKTPKPAKVIRAADLCTKSYLETEAEVDAYLARLKAELMRAIHAGSRARIQ